MCNTPRDGLDGGDQVCCAQSFVAEILAWISVAGEERSSHGGLFLPVGDHAHEIPFGEVGARMFEIEGGKLGVELNKPVRRSVIAVGKSAHTACDLFLCERILQDIDQRKTSCIEMRRCCFEACAKPRVHCLRKAELVVIFDWQLK